jgi:predicted nucleic acid-binding protein
VRTAVDTNVISALWSNEPDAGQIATQLDKAHMQGGLVICAPVYAELLAHPSANQNFVDGFLKDASITIDFSLTEPVWKLVASSFASYANRRRRSGGGAAKRLLVDFIIAAHAFLSADQLMTLDPIRYKQDFSKLHIV